MPCLSACLPEVVRQNRLLTLDDLREDCGFEKERQLLEGQEQGRLYLQGSLECAGFCTRMVHQLEEYNNYILFQNKLADEHQRASNRECRVSQAHHQAVRHRLPQQLYPDAGAVGVFRQCVR